MTELIIPSGSGEIKAGMKMGEWVHKAYIFENDDGGEVYVGILEAKKEGLIEVWNLSLENGDYWLWHDGEKYRVEW